MHHHRNTNTDLRKLSNCTNSAADDVWLVRDYDHQTLNTCLHNGVYDI